MFTQVRALSMARPRGGVLLPLGVGFSPSLVGVGEEGRGRGREGKGGRPPPQLGLGLGGGSPSLAACFSLPLRPNKAH